MKKAPKVPKARTPKEVVADLEKATPLVNEYMKNTNKKKTNGNKNKLIPEKPNEILIPEESFMDVEEIGSL